jgi:hypothetical protein
MGGLDAVSSIIGPFGSIAKDQNQKNIEKCVRIEKYPSVKKH